MRLLTLNTHGLLEEKYDEKLSFFLEYLLRERPDVVALQEVCQRMDACVARELCGGVEASGASIPVKEDNHALAIARGLKRKGVRTSWTYLPVKRGFERFDEGVALMSLSADIEETDVCAVSRTEDIQNWRARKALGMRLKGETTWFYSVHMGWWRDVQEPFEEQWRRLNGQLLRRRREARVWLMGDFNAPAEIRGEGYDLVAGSGWFDAYYLARTCEGGFTVCGEIDGWRTEDDAIGEGRRIDYIWASEAARVKRCWTAFDGTNEMRISDHLAVLAEVEDDR